MLIYYICSYCNDLFRNDNPLCICPKCLIDYYDCCLLCEEEDIPLNECGCCAECCECGCNEYNPLKFYSEKKI